MLVSMPWISSLSSSTICDDNSDGILGNEIVVEPHVSCLASPTRIFVALSCYSLSVNLEHSKLSMQQLPLHAEELLLPAVAIVHL